MSNCCQELISSIANQNHTGKDLLSLRINNFIAQPPSKPKTKQNSTERDNHKKKRKARDKAIQVQPYHLLKPATYPLTLDSSKHYQNLKPPSLLYESAKKKFSFLKIPVKISNQQSQYDLHLGTRSPKDPSPQKSHFWVSSDNGLYSIKIENFYQKIIIRKKVSDQFIVKMISFNETCKGQTIPHIFMITKSGFYDQMSHIYHLKMNKLNKPRVKFDSKPIYHGQIVPSLRGNMHIIKMSSNKNYVLVKKNKRSILAIKVNKDFGGGSGFENGNTNHNHPNKDHLEPSNVMGESGAPKVKLRPSEELKGVSSLRTIEKGPIAYEKDFDSTSFAEEGESVHEIMVELEPITNQGMVVNTIINFFEKDNRVFVITYKGYLVERPLDLLPGQSPVDQCMMKYSLPGIDYQKERILAAQISPDFQLLAVSVAKDEKEEEMRLQVYRIRFFESAEQAYDYHFHQDKNDVEEGGWRGEGGRGAAPGLKIELLAKRNLEIQLQSGVEIQLIINISVWGFPLILVHIIGNRYIHSYLFRNGRIDCFSEPLLCSIRKF